MKRDRGWGGAMVMGGYAKWGNGSSRLVHTVWTKINSSETIQNCCRTHGQYQSTLRHNQHQSGCWTRWVWQRVNIQPHCLSRLAWFKTDTARQPSMMETLCCGPRCWTKIKTKLFSMLNKDQNKQSITEWSWISHESTLESNWTC